MLQETRRPAPRTRSAHRSAKSCWTNTQDCWRSPAYIKMHLDQSCPAHRNSSSSMCCVCSAGQKFCVDFPLCMWKCHFCWFPSAICRQPLTMHLMRGMTVALNLASGHTGWQPLAYVLHLQLCTCSLLLLASRMCSLALVLLLQTAVEMLVVVCWCCNFRLPACLPAASGGSIGPSGYWCCRFTSRRFFSISISCRHRRAGQLTPAAAQQQGW